MSHTKRSDDHHFEFGGAIGASALVLGLPATIMVINVACNKVYM